MPQQEGSFSRVPKSEAPEPNITLPGSVAVARQPLELKSLVRIQAGQLSTQMHPQGTGSSQERRSMRCTLR